MHSLFRWIHGRLVPALMTGAGVALLAAGLLTYQDPAQAVAVTPPATPSPGVTEPPPSLLPLPPLGPEPSAPPSPTPPSDPAATRVATRVVVPALRIDLPVVRPPGDPNHFPFCNVAEFLPQLSQPGFPGVTYLYAHAREGMFLPLLLQSRIDNGSAMLGMLVQVYTSDNLLYLYEITRVLRHQASLDFAFEVTEEQLMLQTSEGPRAGLAGYTGLVTIVVARPLSTGPADPEAASPVARPIACP